MKGKITIKVMQTLVLVTRFAFLFFISMSCTGSDEYVRPGVLLQPVQTDRMVSYFKKGIPFGGYKGDHIDLLLSLDYENVLNRTYLRLWCLYKNNDESSFLMIPQSQFKAFFITTDRQKYEAKVVSPTLILQRVDNLKQEQLITQSIGTALEVISVQNTAITGNDGSQYEVNDRSEKQRDLLKQASTDIHNTRNWYSLYKSSLNSGILRRNTLFSGESVNGFIYFDIPQILERVVTNRPKSNTDENRYISVEEVEVELDKLGIELRVSTQEGEKIINFKTIRDE